MKEIEDLKKFRRAKLMTEHTNYSKPNFFVIGVVKGGTTSLYHYMQQHPDIYLPQVKETNHFAKADIQKEFFLPTYATDVAIDLDAYIASGMKQQVHIAHVDDDRHYAALFSNANGHKAIGEISNSYMICPSAATAIKAYQPEARLIVILRNPIDRLWSQYLMNLREAKASVNEFRTEVLQDDSAQPKGWGVSHQYLELGRYATQLQRYYEHFKKEQILVLFFEEYRTEPEISMERIGSFLSIAPGFDFDFSAESNKASLPRSASLNNMLVKSGTIKAVKGLTPKSWRSKFAKILYSDKNIPKLSPDNRAWLKDIYQKEVDQLAEIVGPDVYTYWPEFRKSSRND